MIELLSLLVGLKNLELNENQVNELHEHLSKQDDVKNQKHQPKR